VSEMAKSLLTAQVVCKTVTGSSAGRGESSENVECGQKWCGCYVMWQTIPNMSSGHGKSSVTDGREPRKADDQ